MEYTFYLTYKNKINAEPMFISGLSPRQSTAFPDIVHCPFPPTKLEKSRKPMSFLIIKREFIITYYMSTNVDYF